jgi:hypothetical protein
MTIRFSLFGGKRLPAAGGRAVLAAARARRPMNAELVAGRHCRRGRARDPVGRFVAGRLIHSLGSLRRESRNHTEHVMTAHPRGLHRLRHG